MSPKHTVVPTVTMSTPANAGPTTRALLTTTPLRLTALARSSERNQPADESLAGGRVGDLDDPAGHADGDERTDAGPPCKGEAP